MITCKALALMGIADVTPPKCTILLFLRRTVFLVWRLGNGLSAREVIKCLAPQTYHCAPNIGIPITPQALAAANQPVLAISSIIKQGLHRHSPDPTLYHIMTPVAI